jgi:chromosomal replication initiator protein
MVAGLAAGSYASPQDPSDVLYANIRNRLTPQDFETWFEKTPCEFFHPDRFVLTAPNGFRKAWMEKNYRELVHDAARSLFELEPRIEIQVRNPRGSAAAKPPAQSTAFSVDLSPAGGVAERSESAPTPSNTRAPTNDCGLRPKQSASELNPNFTFETFVSGSPNQVAHAAGVAVSENPGKAYNPLFIYGDRGLGKTHLLHAICHRLFHFARLRVTYFTAESFTTRFVSSITEKKTEEFRQLCSSSDVLVLDDIHFLNGKEKTQDELFCTLNELLEAQKQVVVSSVCSPKETAGMQERLVSRFRWGLVARMERPDFETRVAVLLRKAHSYGHDLPLDVAEFIAKHFVDSLREIEGALARVVSVATLEESGFSLAVARSALRELLEEEQHVGAVTVSQILQTVQEHYKIRPRELLSRSKVRVLVHARQMGMYLARELTPLSLEEIGAHFGGRDHTTVLYALERIRDKLMTKPQVQGDLHLLKNRIATHRAL